jgi:16S rRNA (uracil1498-N3)-methyltransferase
MKGIVISAMLQSQQVWLPILHEPQKLLPVIQNSQQASKLIAHCEKENDKQPLSAIPQSEDAIIIIGPEGDFSKQEIESAVQHKFIPVALGITRLRTETAGIVAATLLRI